MTIPPEIRTMLDEYFRDPLSFPDEFKSWMVKYIETAPPTFPVSQLIGFTQFVVKVAPRVVTKDTTTSGNYDPLSPSGPTLTGLPNGNYLILFGAVATSMTTTSYMSVSINGATATDADAATYEVDRGNTGAITKALSNGSNSLQAMYKASAAGGTQSTAFRDRWLIAIKYSNL